MEERVQALGGVFAIDARAEGGTQVAIVMPAPPWTGREPA
jgi:signal transduction histidine kinase